MKGLIHIYCGDGKGKTTCSVGLTVRMAGHGKKILFVQFLKGQPTGELRILEALPNVTVARGKPLIKFTFAMTPEEKKACLENQNALFLQAVTAAKQGECDLLVLDEIMGAISTGTLDWEPVLEFVTHKPESLELVMTGRNPRPELVELADYVSEIQKVKHPYDQGIGAREGVEK